ncbi:MAG: hypothetical protein D6675_15870 [Gemmatimonadetes bacterium]|nr:MAG: hypothetical protein D6675_15870 [Gemmatimonadota bacterium]
MRFAELVIGASWKIGRPMGIDLELHVSWFVVMVLITVSLATSFYTPFDIPIAFFLGAVSAALLFISITLHELAHSYFAIKYGIGVHRIVLFMFGGVAQIKQEPPTPGAEFVIAIAGPLCSFGIGMLLLLIGWLLLPLWVPAFHFWVAFDQIISGSITGGNSYLAGCVALLGYVMLLNFVLATINLVPAFPLDGGRLLRAMLWRLLHNFEKATVIASAAGQLVGGFLMGGGFFFLFEPDVLNGVWLILLGFFLFRAARVAYNRARMTQHHLFIYPEERSF